MRYQQYFWIAGLVAFCVLACIFIACDDDIKPTEPGPAPELKDYVVYTYDPYNEGLFYGYHPSSGQIDTLDLGIEALHGICVSPDGSILYVAGRDRTWLVSLDSGKVVDEFLLPGRLAVSPDNQWLAIIRSGELTIARVGVYEPLFTSNVGAWTGVFSTDSKKFYTTDTASIYVLSMQDGFPVTKTAIQTGVVLQVIPTDNEDRMFLFDLLYICSTILEVYDAATDSIVYSHNLMPGNSDMALSPDNRYLAYTNAKSPDSWCSQIPSPQIYIYDIVQNEVSVEISTTDSTQESVWACDLAITPDGRWLVGLDAFGYTFVTINMETLTVERYDSLDPGTEIFHLTELSVQANP